MAGRRSLEFSPEILDAKTLKKLKILAKIFERPQKDLVSLAVKQFVDHYSLDTAEENNPFTEGEDEPPD